MNYYTQALKIAGGRIGAITSMKRQVNMIAQHIDVSNMILSLFGKQKTAIFTGHMIDQQDRISPRFPPYIEPIVREAITQSIESLNIQVGYCPWPAVQISYLPN